MKLVSGKRVGLVTNHTGLTTDLRTNIDIFYNHPEINLVKLFGPEHGVRGNIAAGSKISDRKDKKTDLPVVSLYGENRKPVREHLKNIDTLIFDIQDLGVRFYTYISTLLYCLESCGENNIEFIVLDRLNPLGRRIEGNVLKKEFLSFIGLYPLPHRHGMTAGEIATWANREFELNTELKVIKTSGWQGQYFDKFDLFWIPPSPAIPHYNTALTYPITCMLEGTNISEGRGTANPFEYLGASWIEPGRLAEVLEKENLAGVRFRPVYFTPDSSKYEGEECGGVHIFIEDRERVSSYQVALTIIKTLFELYPEKTKWRKPENKNRKYFFDFLMGTDKVRKEIDNHNSVKSIMKSWKKEIEGFRREREKYLLY
ncbi:MAG: exo-beta-N-acetylmuramidase NamZ domain-containing protein [Halanaerobiales bacterium]